MAKVFLKFNTAVLKETELTKDVTTFGRKPDNDIVIDNAAVSGHHGKIVKEGDQFFVEDLNSTNGTYVNGRRIKKSKLENKDNIRAAKHILEFITQESDAPPMPSATPAPGQKSATLDVGLKAQTPEEQKEILRKSLGLSPEAATPERDKEKAEGQPAGPVGMGVIKFVSGAVNPQQEIPLKELVTYIGTSDQAVIKIKGFLAPSLAAAISRRPEGYFLKAVKPGYPKVNGNTIQEQVLLESGALIECGGTNMVFYLNEPKKEGEKEKQSSS